MTAPTTPPSTQPSQSGGGVDVDQLLGDVETTLTAVQSNDWVTAGLSGATSALDLLGSGGGDPLSGIASAGFGFLADLVSFLAEPLNTLAGNPGAVTSNADGLQGAGQGISSHADSYQQAAGKETPGWSGGAASSYQGTAKELAGELRAMSKASTAVSSAMSGAADVVAKAQQIITQYVTEASGKINMIMTQALAAAQATFGASVAAAIPQAVQVATEYGGKIAEKMGALLSSSQNLVKLLLAVVKSLKAINQAITQTTGHNGTDTPKTGAPKTTNLPKTTESPTTTEMLKKTEQVPGTNSGPEYADPSARVTTN
ncbi:hypothetical protein [Amycolatopsis anabasis]|uniref:hypothetical protein n=1 Tax=Amycolatopsis anabasis TaxID=1840409 RepID=UPI0015D11AA9|nr:hypothetical protein [Amycolatopsis anabasis]